VKNVVRSHRRHRRWCTRVRLIKTHTHPFVFIEGVHVDGPGRLGREASRTSKRPCLRGRPHPNARKC
jgi:hypothetical protein